MGFEGRATIEAFNKAYETNLSQLRTYKEAYQLTEKQHVNQFGDRKYSSYSSFRVNRCKFLKRVTHVNHN